MAAQTPAPCIGQHLTNNRLVKIYLNGFYIYFEDVSASFQDNLENGTYGDFAKLSTHNICIFF